MTEHQNLPPISGSGDHATVKLSDYLLAIRAGDLALAQERDRRYAEVKAAEEKALRVKEKADKVALGLSRESQTYKDTKANELREQISSERGLYATKEDIAGLREYFDVLHRPVVEFMAGQTKVDTVKRLDVAQILQMLATLVMVVTLIVLVVKKP